MLAVPLAPSKDEDIGSKKRPLSVDVAETVEETAEEKKRRRLQKAKNLSGHYTVKAAMAMRRKEGEGRVETDRKEGQRKVNNTPAWMT